MQLGQELVACHHGWEEPCDCNYFENVVQVPGISNIRAVAAGTAHSLALRTDGTVWHWGWTWSLVGAGPDGPFSITATFAMPFQMQGLSNIVAIYANDDYSAMLRADGTVFFWGHAGFDENTGERIVYINPVQIDDGERFFDIEALIPPQPWWAALPAWVQFILRWFAFGFIWM
jgi:hypothetical protein